MKKSSPIYALIDPASGGYSASRIASIVMILVDTAWAIAAVHGWPPKDSYGPVSSMLSAVTVAAFGAYGANSFARAWHEPPPCGPKPGGEK